MNGRWGILGRKIFRRLMMEMLRMMIMKRRKKKKKKKETRILVKRKRSGWVFSCFYCGEDGGSLEGMLRNWEMGV